MGSTRPTRSGGAWRGKTGVPFRYRDLGSAATIGRFKAIVSVRGVRLSGFPGWLVWFFVHIGFLNGFGHRASTMLRWFQAMVGRSRPERVFSVGHTGGDLSLPDEVKARIMPNPFPVVDDVPRWMALLSEVDSDPATSTGKEDGAAEPT